MVRLLPPHHYEVGALDSARAQLLRSSAPSLLVRSGEYPPARDRTEVGSDAHLACSIHHTLRCADDLIASYVEAHNAMGPAIDAALDLLDSDRIGEARSHLAQMADLLSVERSHTPAPDLPPHLRDLKWE